MQELLALEERIGNVSTGLSEETILNRLKQKKYSLAVVSQLEAEPCCICQVIMTTMTMCMRCMFDSIFSFLEPFSTICRKSIMKEKILELFNAAMISIPTALKVG